MKNILVVERDDDSLALLKEILEEKEYNVLSSHTSNRHTGRNMACLQKEIR